MKEKDINARIINFWNWFESISDDLFKNVKRSDLLDQIDTRVSFLGRLDWEIGPLDESNYYFAISPNLDDKKFQLTQEIVGYAPNCKGWKFFSSKPSKEWEGKWTMKNEKNEEIFIDTTDWKYVLYQFEDSTFAMDILIDKVDGDLNTCQLAVDIALIGYLGEEKFMNLIKDIKIITDLGNEQINRLTKLRNILKHIDDISS